MVSKTNAKVVEKVVQGDTLVDYGTSPKKYSPFPLNSFDRGRHISVEEAYKLVKSQRDTNLNVNYLRQVVEGGDIIVYQFGGKSYLDRLDLGRVFHTEREGRGITIERFFSQENQDIFESFGQYKPRDLELKSKNGEVLFEMKGSMFPESWTDEHAQIVAQKYFFKPHKPEWKEKLKSKIGVEYENSPKHLFTRISNFFAQKGWELGYFDTEKDRDTFRDELTFLQAHRMAAFNSPVYFNVGIYDEYGIDGPPAISFIRDAKTGKVSKVKEGCYVHPVAHACFIRAAKDNLVSILEQTVDEGGIFSHGSGCGGNIGALRERGGVLGGGGKASGPISFMKVLDTGAGTIKSGGKSRRAARMQTMDYTHPDIKEFVELKVGEDKKALVLMKNGYSTGMDGEAYSTVAFQNSNLSVRLDNDFFKAVKNKGKISLISVHTGEVLGKISAEDLLKKISFGSWRSGDPGVQYTDPIEEYNTCPLSGKINSSNPCGEYIFLDDTSCNLASTNLLAFTDLGGKFDAKSYVKANRIMLIAQDIANNVCAYPVKDIAINSPDFATIGLGYTNLGATLMRKGLAYDSEEGRAFTAAITALMAGSAYETSAELAEHLGTFTHFQLNKKPMLSIIEKHQNNLENIVWENVNDEEIKRAVFTSWSKVKTKGEETGFRNAQVTVLAPTGTTSYIMGCDTTGIEAAYDLIIKKQLAGGGEIILINQELPNALNNLGYGEEQKDRIKSYLIEKETLIGCPDIRPEHRKIFSTSRGDRFGEGAIPFNSHIKMCAAAQPFISGGISKTMNLPESASVKQIYDGFLLGHSLGLKGLTVFRDNSKPISAMGSQNVYKEFKRGEKRDLSNKRMCKEFEFTIANNGSPQTIHLIVSEYPEGTPGQITFLAYKGGQSLGTLVSIAGISGSKSLKRGVDLEEVVGPWLEHNFKPNGMVYGYEHIHHCKNVLELAAKILLIEYRGRTEFADDPKAFADNPQLIAQLRGFQNGAFRNHERAGVDSWDFNQVMKDPEYGGFEEMNSKDPMRVLLLKAKEEAGKNITSSNLLPCPNCEQNTLRRISSNCYECPCGHKIGGCAQ